MITRNHESNTSTLEQQQISKLPGAFVSKRALVQKLSYENEFDENTPVSYTHFHMNGFSRKLPLTQRHKATRNDPLHAVHCAKLRCSRYHERHIKTEIKDTAVCKCSPNRKELPTSADLVAPTETDEDDKLPLLPVSLTEREVSVDEKVKI